MYPHLGTERDDALPRIVLDAMRLRRMGVSRSAKRVIASLAAARPFRMLFSGLRRRRAAVFMLHRFADPQHGTSGHDPDFVRSVLDALRRERVPLLSLGAMVEEFLAGHHPEGVVFTVDDGYGDFATIGAPVFQEFDCPVTVFLTTGFLDNLYWFWWDRIAFAMKGTRLREVTLPLTGEPRCLPLATQSDRAAAITTVASWVKSLPEDRRGAAVETALSALNATLPDRAPPAFQPMTWSNVRRLSRAGVEFAPHGVRHASMATIESRQASLEVRESVKRIRDELSDVTPVFCYPYGLAFDVSREAARIVRGEGLAAAVTAIGGYIGPDSMVDPFTLPRFPFPDSMAAVWQIVSGFERAKAFLRTRWAERSTTTDPMKVVT